MNYNHVRSFLLKLCLITMISLPLLLASGCAISGKRSGILSSREQQWTIPAGTTFKGMQRPIIKDPVDVIAEEDMAVLYKGKLLELEKAADARAFKAADTAKTQGMVLGIVGALLAAFAAAMGKGLWDRISKKKT